MDKNTQKLTKRLKYKSTHQKGSSLLEILISLLVIAVGLLGLSAMQTVSLKNINNSHFRALATVYAYDMAERMRSNLDGVTAGNYDNITAPGANTSCGGAICTAAEIATLDGFQWNAQIASELPSGTGTVTENANVYTITVTWNEQQRQLVSSNSNIVSTSFALEIQL